MDNKQNKPKNKKAVFGRLTIYLKPHLVSVTIGLATNIGLGLLAPIPGLQYGRITDHVIKGGAPEPTRMAILIKCMIVLLVVFAAQSILGFGRAFIMHVLGEKVIMQFRKDIYAKLQLLSVSYFSSRQTGEIMSRVTSDSQQVEEFVNHAADTLISDPIRLAAFCYVMFKICPTLAWISLAPVPIVFVLAYTFSRKIRPIYRKVRERLGDINAGLQERISGVSVVKSFAREDYEFAHFKTEVENYYRERVKAILGWTRFFPAINFTTQVGFVAVWVVGAAFVMHQQITMGTIIIFTSYLSLLYEPIRNLANINDTIQRSMAAAERIFEVIDEEPTVADDEAAIQMPGINGRVEFRNVSFKYEDGEEVLKDINISAEPGQIVALVGRSGAGKTSIVNLIPRFYDPQSGQILIDGYDIKRVTQRSLRSQIAMVLQDTFLFNGTVKDNIRYGKLDATDEEIIAAAKTANADEFIVTFPNGYDTEIGERGIKLSGGQKQRLAIARAVLADPRILILDEATSSVDSESEYLIHRAMDSLMEGRTTFVIAHRLSTIKHADQIITLEDGRVTEVGDHKSLVEQDGVYSQMYSMQFRLNDEL